MRPCLRKRARDPDNDGMGTTGYAARATWRSYWRITLLIAVITGLLGAVSLGALAGARRTDSAYGRYLRAARASDVMVDVPGPLPPVIHAIEHLPGVTASAAYLGLAAEPVIHGKVSDSWELSGLNGSLDGEYFRLDKLTVVAGRLPRPGATGAVLLTPGLAAALHVTVGGHVAWQFFRQPTSHGLPANAPPYPSRRVTYRVAALVIRPPALGDSYDDVATAILPPGATRPYLDGEYQFGWVALRLHGGPAGVPALRAELAALGTRLTRQYGFPVGFLVRPLATVERQAQQAIEPQALALGVLGGLVAVALLVLTGQGLALLLSRSAADAAILRAMGLTRAGAAVVAALWGAVAIALGIGLAIAGALAISPLAPVGPVRALDPARGVRPDWLVLAGGGAALAILLTVLLAWLAWRAVRQAPEVGLARPAAGRCRGAAQRPARGPGHRDPARAGAADRRGAGRPGPGHPGRIGGGGHRPGRGAGVQRQPDRPGQPPAPVRLELGRADAVRGRLRKLAPGRHEQDNQRPARRDRLVGLRLRAADRGGPGGPGHGDRGARRRGRPAGHQRAPADRAGPDRAGRGHHAPAWPAARRQDRGRRGNRPPADGGRHGHAAVVRGVADRSRVARPRRPGPGARPAGHREPDVAAVCHRERPGRAGLPVGGGHQRVVAGRRAPDRPPDRGRRARRQPGGTYRLGPQPAAQIANFRQMGGQPLAIAVGVAAAAVLALGLTILASVRRRRRELALLKCLGMERGQVRAIVASQATAILAVACLAGVPLGIAGGRWAWTEFARSIGVVPDPVVPVAAIAVGVAALLIAGNLLASWPGLLAARTPPAALLRAE